MRALPSPTAIRLTGCQETFDMVRFDTLGGVLPGVMGDCTNEQR
jgi:hypothetical protein